MLTPFVFRLTQKTYAQDQQFPIPRRQRRLAQKCGSQTPSTGAPNLCAEPWYGKCSTPFRSLPSAPTTQSPPRLIHHPAAVQSVAFSFAYLILVSVGVVSSTASPPRILPSSINSTTEPFEKTSHHLPQQDRQYESHGRGRTKRCAQP